MKRLGAAEDTVVAAIAGKGSRKGNTFFGRLGDVIQRPPMWAAVALALSATGERGRRAALRGGVGYLSAAAAHLPVKALAGRRHPPGSARHQLGPFTSSFPSGHAASDLAFALGAAQELPLAFVPLSACTMAAHWSLVRKRAHYPSDVFVGGLLGIAVALTMWKLWPAQQRAGGRRHMAQDGTGPSPVAPSDGAGGRRGASATSAEWTAGTGHV